MRKTNFIFGAMLILILIISSGCAKSNEKVATISVNSKSDYVQTFEDLDLGILYDFNLDLPNADKRWVRIWVEEYKDGEKETDSIAELSFGESPNSTTKGNVGFGIINLDADAPLLFLYAPGLRTHTIEESNSSKGFHSWEYAIGDKKVELKLGETYLLAIYRQSAGDSMRTYDLQDEDEVQQMIKEDGKVLLLKIKIDESNE